MNKLTVWRHLSRTASLNLKCEKLGEKSMKTSTIQLRVSILAQHSPRQPATSVGSLRCSAADTL
jgi:hypothetical protein